jgi:subtilase family serine protease
MDTALTPPSTQGPGTQPPDQRMIGGQSLPPLSAGQCTRLTLNAYAQMPPASMGEGAFYLGAIVDAYQQEQELREDNNTFISGLIGVGYRSDLVVTQVSGPANLRHGDPFTATVKVCNQGTEPTSGWNGGPRVELYLSMDEELNPPTQSGPYPEDQRMIGSLDLPTLGAGQCVTRDVNANAYAPPQAMGEGVLYLGALVDPMQAEQELREDNNAFIGGRMGIGNRPDLVVTELKGPASVRPWESFTATVKVCNQGTEASFSSWSYLELYLSTDTTLTAPMMPGPGAPPTDQRMIGTVDVPMLQAGQCVTRDVNVNAWLPHDAQGDGAYYLGAIVDVNRAEMELREDNNAFIGGLMGVGNSPDLVVTELKGPASVRPWESFTATVKVCNQGTEPSGYNAWPQLELYLSTDTELTPPTPANAYPTDQRMVASETLQPLQPGECSTRTLSAYAAIPPDAPWESALFLGAIVDAYAFMPELREDNNVLVGGLVGAGNRSDLVVTEVSGPASVIPSDGFTATVKVCNQGTESSGVVFSPARPRLDLYLSTSPSVVVQMPGMPYPPPEGQRLIGGTELDPLAAGQCVTLSVPAISSLPSGAQNVTAFHLAAVVDPVQSEQELREDNNAFVGGLMGVGHAADLVITEVSGPASVQRGQSFTASVKVCNQGTEPSSAINNARLEVYLSTTGTVAMPTPGMPLPQSSERLVGSVDVLPLAAGQCQTLTVPASANAPQDAVMDGALFLGAIIDAGRYVSELREDNNVTVGGLMGVGNLPDLVITDVSGPASVRHGDPFTASVEVCNQGTSLSGSSYGSMLGLFISTGTTLTPMGPGPMPMEQVMVASVQVDPLAPGQCTTLSVQGGAYLPPAAQGAGSFYLGAYVDPYKNESELREDNNARADQAFELTW